jgi:hypothetical protein
MHDIFLTHQNLFFQDKVDLSIARTSILTTIYLSMVALAQSSTSGKTLWL